MNRRRSLIVAATLRRRTQRPRIRARRTGRDRTRLTWHRGSRVGAVRGAGRGRWPVSPYERDGPGALSPPRRLSASGQLDGQPVGEPYDLGDVAEVPGGRVDGLAQPGVDPLGADLAWRRSMASAARRRTAPAPSAADARVAMPIRLSAYDRWWPPPSLRASCRNSSTARSIDGLGERGVGRAAARRHRRGRGRSGRSRRSARPRRRSGSSRGRARRRAPASAKVSSAIRTARLHLPGWPMLA